MRSSYAALALWLVAAQARAHPSPAEPPEFFPADCIIVVDKSAQASFHLDYAVPTEDTAPEVDHVSLPDSKTHQFFALAGTLIERANDHVFLPFDDESGVLRTMPTWLTASDVMRTADGVRPEDLTAFTAEMVATSDVLENDAELASAVRPLVSGTVRVPITEAQSVAGVTWDLADVPAGVYQLAAYIFSPPYNGWAVRPGLIKVIDGSEAQAPAVTLDRVAARVFAGQGRRVRGCVDAPDGSTLELLTRVQAETPGAFEPRATEPVVNGAFELCLANDGSDEALEVRVEVHTPARRRAATQSSDAISLFSDVAACTPSEQLCCPEGSSSDAGSATPDAGPPIKPMQPGPVVDAGERGDSTDPGPRADASAESPPSARPMTAAAEAPNEGCAVGKRSTRGGAWLAPTLLAVLWLARRVVARAKNVQNGLMSRVGGSSQARTEWRRRV